MNELELSSLSALGPVDGRYGAQTQALRPYFSEFGLIRHRVRVEVAWLLFLAGRAEVPELPDFTAKQRALLTALADDFSLQDAAEVKALEAETQHDVKAVEYFIKARLEQSGDKALAAVKEFVHFGCTSEDINNLAYALMLQAALNEALLPAMQALTQALRALAKDTAGLPMLARTHGQPASPTTLGKEVANVVARLERQLAQLCAAPDSGKAKAAARLSGAPDSGRSQGAAVVSAGRKSEGEAQLSAAPGGGKSEGTAPLGADAGDTPLAERAQLRAAPMLGKWGGGGGELQCACRRLSGGGLAWH